MGLYKLQADSYFFKSCTSDKSVVWLVFLYKLPLIVLAREV